MENLQPVVELHELAKHYGSVVAVSNISLSIGRGEIVCLLGPSGCGKTTTLRMVAGFAIPTSGRVVIQGTDVSAMPPHKRDIGMVFQNYALFPHLTVEENVAFAPRNVGMKAREVSQRVAELLDLVHLSKLSKRFPRELSGGQQQRVALARALAVRPAVLLLDEPFSNLDAKLRAQMREDLRDLIERLQTTTLFVTHDQEEALAIAHRIVIMSGGRIEQIGSPNDVYDAPATEFVAQFMGRCNFMAVQRIEDDRSVVLVGGSRIEVANTETLGDIVAIRPHNVLLSPTPGASRLSGRLVKSMYLGPVTHLTLDLGESRLLVDVPSERAQRYKTGETLSVYIEPHHARLVNAGGGGSKVA
jgi:putative spermidine/putrescine transport system ATP-binding protein